MQKLPLTFLLLVTSLLCHAREDSVRSPFKGGYLRLGFNTMGKSLNPSLSVISNLKNGDYGTKTGYVLDLGHIFYFNKKSTFPVKFGLDWTILSATYNQFNWDSYVASKGDASAEIEGKKIAASAATKLGLNLAINPVSKLVIDVRAQAAYSFYFFDMSYYAHAGQPNESYFSFTDEQLTNGDPESVKNRVKSTVLPNFGLTARYGVIGLAFDYMPGKLKYNYDAIEGHSAEKFKLNTVQLKLNLAF